MPEMTNPMNALTQLQIALDNNVISPTSCELHKDILVEVDQPNGLPRYTYFKHSKSKVQAIALFVLIEHIEGTPCFQMGWATLESVRNLGHATNIVEKGIDELKNGLQRHGIKIFYLEAIISSSNQASIKLATKLISDSPTECTDSFSGEPALQFLRLVK